MANCSTTRTETPVGGHVGDRLVELADDQRGQAHRQLVDEEDRRVGAEPAGEGQHLLLAARQRAGQLLAALARGGGTAVKATSVRRSSDAPQEAATRRLSATLRFGNTDRPSRMWQTPSRASTSAPAPLRWRPSTWRQPRVGVEQPAHDAEGRGLAGAVRAEQGGDLPRRTAMSTPWSTSMRP